MGFFFAEKLHFLELRILSLPKYWNPKTHKHQNKAKNKRQKNNFKKSPANVPTCQQKYKIYV
jgi:hypothetical protein